MTSEVDQIQFSFSDMLCELCSLYIGRATEVCYDDRKSVNLWNKEKMDYEPDRDLLSDLPLSIIHIILALVPIRDAIRTSILSRQWRYTWTSLPQLVFDNRCVCVSPEDKSLTKYEDFITRVLFRHRGPIHKFEMSCSFLHSTPNVDEWVFCLARNDIRELILDMGFYESSSFEIHSSIYSCKKLTYLQLFNCPLDPQPSTFKGFLFLRGAFLREVHMSPNGVESLFANSPLLEKLRLLDTMGPELRISAPNLKYLDLEGDYIEISLYAPLLAEMSVSLNDNDFTAKHVQQISPVCNYNDCLGGCTNLEKLMGEGSFSKFLSIGIESCHQSLVFHHLKVIELGDVNVEDVKEMSVVIRLVIGAPNLQNLKLDTDIYWGGEAHDVSLKDFGCAPNFTFKKLMVVKMNGVIGLPLEKEFIKFLLESSPVLETMHLHLFSELGAEEKQNLRDELLGCTCASPIAKRLFRETLIF